MSLWVDFLKGWKKFDGTELDTDDVIVLDNNLKREYEHMKNLGVLIKEEDIDE